MKVFIYYFKCRYIYRYYNIFNKFKTLIVDKTHIFYFFKKKIDNNFYAQLFFKIKFFF